MRKALVFVFVTIGGVILALGSAMAIDIRDVDLTRPFPLSQLEYPISDAPYNPWLMLEVDNIQVNSDRTTQLQNEESLFINPTNTDNAVAIWRDFRLGYRRVGVGYTFDSGQTWYDTLLYVPPHPRQSDPVLVVDDDGTFYACTLTLRWSMDDPSGIYIQKSTDGGVSWSDPYVAVDSVEGVFEDKQWITLDRTSNFTNGNIYITWTRFYDTQILLVSSTDGGETYSDPVPVSDEEGVQWSVPAVGMFSDVFVAWYQYWPVNGIFMDVSADQGQTFGQDRLIVNTNAWPDEINGDILVFPYPALTSDVSLLSPFLGNLYLAFMDMNQTDMDIFFIKSEDNGYSWSQPIRINDDNESNGRDQFHPWLSVDESGVIHAIFYDRRLDPANYLFDLYYTKSEDGGETWSANERISNVSSSPGDAILAGLIGEYIGLSAWQGEVAMVWTDTRNGNQDVFSARLSPTSVGDEDTRLPRRLKLAPPYPNPFNSSTVISFYSSEEAQVRLDIVDILGRTVSELFDGVCRQGVTRFAWQGDDVSSGTYFVRLKSPDGIQAQKAILLR